MIPTVPHNDWLTIDEATDVVASLRHALHLLGLVSTELTIWKWVLLSLHSALQGAMVCHLNGTANLGCLSAKSATAWLDWHDRDLRGEINWVDLGIDELGMPTRRPAAKADFPPRAYLAKPSELFERLTKSHKRIESGVGQLLNLSDRQKWAFQKLDGLRNQFTHFSPMGWSLEIVGLPNICLETLFVVGVIESDPWPFRHLDADPRTELKNLILELSDVLKPML